MLYICGQEAFQSRPHARRRGHNRRQRGASGIFGRGGAQGKWGDKYETYEKKIEEAVKDVFGKTITYDGEIITAAFHAISCGQTFSAEEVWGKDVPYLKSVTSAGDRLSPDYSSTLTLTADEFKKAFAGSGAEFGGDAEKWIGEIKKTDSGYISCAVIGEKNSRERRYAKSWGSAAPASR